MDDVLVIGAGPAGSRVAAALASKGHRVTVLEEHPEAGCSVCCTGIVGKECHDLLGVESSVLRTANSATFVSPGAKTVRLKSDSPQAYVLDRSALDRCLARRAEAAGASFVFGCTVENASRVNGHVEVESLRAGARDVFKARALVLASGFNPWLTSSLGFGTVGDFAVGAQAEVEVEGIEEVEIRFSRELAPGFFTWIVPTVGKKSLVGLMCRENPGRHLRAFLAQLQLDRRVRSGDIPMRYGRIPLKPLRRSYGNRMLAVGDAAGQVKPTTGGGIYYGLLCADMASSVLDEALRADDLSKERLSAYQRTWKRALSSELRVGYFSRMAFERLSNRNIDALFDVVKTYSLDKVALNMEGFSFDWHGGVLGLALNHHAVGAVLGASLRSVLGHHRDVPKMCRLPAGGDRSPTTQASTSLQPDHTDGCAT